MRPVPWDRFKNLKLRVRDTDSVSTAPAIACSYKNEIASIGSIRNEVCEFVSSWQVSGFLQSTSTIYNLQQWEQL